jgi:hypothetical protein
MSSNLHDVKYFAFMSTRSYEVSKTSTLERKGQQQPTHTSTHKSQNVMRWTALERADCMPSGIFRIENFPRHRVLEDLKDGLLALEHAKRAL